MPLYRYSCSDCGSNVEYLVKVGQSPKECKECGSSRLVRGMSLPAPNKREFFGVGDNTKGFSSLENQVIDQAKKDLKPHLDAGG